MSKQLTKLQAIQFLINYALLDNDTYQFYIDEWYQAEMFSLICGIVRSRRESFSHFELENAKKAAAIQSGAYRISSDASDEEKKKFELLSEFDLTL